MTRSPFSLLLVPWSPDRLEALSYFGSLLLAPCALVGCSMFQFSSASFDLPSLIFDLGLSRFWAVSPVFGQPSANSNLLAGVGLFAPNDNLAVAQLSTNHNVGQASRLPPSATTTERNRSRWRARWAGGTPALRWARPGSWSQCTCKSDRRLSMNRVRKRKQAPRTPNAAAQ